MSRRDEIAAGLERVRARIETACREVDRDPDEVTLVVVTKFFPASDVQLLAELGVTDVGENRHQEAAAKVAECADVPVRWHYIGGLQSNKAAAVASYADGVIVGSAFVRTLLDHPEDRRAGLAALEKLTRELAEGVRGA